MFMSISSWWHPVGRDVVMMVPCWQECCHDGSLFSGMLWWFPAGRDDSIMVYCWQGNYDGERLLLWFHDYREYIMMVLHQWRDCHDDSLLIGRLSWFPACKNVIIPWWLSADKQGCHDGSLSLMCYGIKPFFCYFSIDLFTQLYYILLSICLPGL